MSIFPEDNRRQQHKEVVRAGLQEHAEADGQNAMFLDSISDTEIELKTNTSTSQDTNLSRRSTR